MLVAPALEFHPSTESILGYFSPAIEVERIGVGIHWRRELDVMSCSGCEAPAGPSNGIHRACVKMEANSSCIRPYSRRRMTMYVSASV